MARPRFRPPWWSWLLLLPLLALLCGLGTWQLNRGLQKAALIADYGAADQAAPLVLRGKVPATAVPKAMMAEGRYAGERQLLLDNQSMHRQPGYQVLTPFTLEDGSQLLVNRGWIAAAARADVSLAVPEGTQRVQGLWRDLPRPGLRLAVDNCGGEAWPRIVQYPRAEDLRCLYGERMRAGLLLLAPEAPGGFVRDWHPAAEIPPSRHYGYAAQWFTFAATLLVIFVVLNLRRSS